MNSLINIFLADGNEILLSTKVATFITDLK